MHVYVPSERYFLYSPTFPEILKCLKKETISQNGTDEHLFNGQLTQNLEVLSNQDSNSRELFPHLCHIHTSNESLKQEMDGMQRTFQKYKKYSGDLLHLQRETEKN